MKCQKKWCFDSLWNGRSGEYETVWASHGSEFIDGFCGIRLLRLRQELTPEEEAQTMTDKTNKVTSCCTLPCCAGMHLDSLVFSSLCFLHLDLQEQLRLDQEPARRACCQIFSSSPTTDNVPLHCICAVIE